ncbi:DER1-like protein, putative [Plasmodium chabaudi chabaudi]|uniref:Derlin n=1 Tax=Plasmodium chabaudi chabaudi TaxID=31271 RepID=A0A4V0K4J1_PLACU|nr:DER1-like protein, putative [Plasmodium chabaudi chabaudi]VTZ67257.1 DER1-like protein, putative [Plasmodium chabaudi chabaudi]|eukprot:XP_735933.2 DER1-like protein, putative [Plasmodium chabaudi chabaudi]
MLIYRFLFFLSIIASVRYYYCDAKVCVNDISSQLLKNISFKNSVRNDGKTKGQNTCYNFRKEKKNILKKKIKKKYSLNNSKGYTQKKKKYNLYFLNSSKFTDIKENVKAWFNLDYIENHYAYSYIKSFARIPPITKIYLINTFILSVLIHLNKNVYKYILYDFDKIFKNGEIWRLVTPYFYIGNLYLQYILMFNYLNIYMSSVEIAHYKNPEDFLIFLTYGYISNIFFTIIASMYNENVMDLKKHIRKIRSLITAMPSTNNKDDNKFVQKETYNHLGYVFSTYILYYWSRINEGSLINCFDLFFIKAEYIPFFFVIQNILLYNEFSFFEVASILSSYTFFTYEKYLKSNFLRALFRGFLKFIRVYPMYNMYKEEYE